jgi:hypothetical protein
VYQFGAEFILKCRDLLADGGLANPTFLRDSGEAPLFNQPNERLHRIEFIHTHLPIPLRNRFYAKSNDSMLVVHFKNAGKKDFLPSRRAFLAGIASIPHSAKSVCDAGTST